MGARAYRRNAIAHKHTPRTQTSVSSAPITSVVAIATNHPLLSSAASSSSSGAASGEGTMNGDGEGSGSTSERRRSAAAVSMDVSLVAHFPSLRRPRVGPSKQEVVLARTVNTLQSSQITA